MNSKNESAYWSKEVSDILQISDSTLRKWCLSLEKNGCEFVRGTNNSRAFVERDVLLLRRMKELIQSKGVTVENATNLVMASVKSEEVTTGVHEANSLTVHVQHELLLKEILERQERLEEFNKQLLTRLDEQQQYINDKLEQRDLQLTTALKETLEVKKMIAASLEAPKEEKKGFFARLFGK
jgi:DNA-binding transcriptional MerR regulator